MRPLSKILLPLFALLIGCSHSPTEPEPSETISINMISIEGDVAELRPRLTIGTNYETNFANNTPNVAARPAPQIVFDIPSATDYGVFLFDISGNEVFRFIDSGPAGTVVVTLDFTGRPSGIYVIAIIAGELAAATKFILVK